MYLQNKIILGTAQTDLNYGFNKSKDLSSLINIIKEKKFTLDTAPTYQNIESFFASFQEAKLKIISKLPIIESKLEEFERKLDAQIKIIFQKVNYRNLEAILIHDPLLPLDGERWKIAYRQLIKLKKIGKIKKIGVSVYNTYELDRVLKVFTPEIVQFPLNIFNQSFLNNDYLKKLKKKKYRIACKINFFTGFIDSKRKKSS